MSAKKSGIKKASNGSIKSIFHSLLGIKYFFLQKVGLREVIVGARSGEYAGEFPTPALVV